MPPFDPADLQPAFGTDFFNLAVLVSGGLDSAVLLGEALERFSSVHPLYVRTGLLWEAEELRYLRQFLQTVRSPGLQPLRILELPVTDLYGAHWSLTGRQVPAADSPDAAVFLPGRNVLLLSKAMLWCHLQRVSGLALALLESNPFPDATPAFFAAYQEVLNRSVGGKVEVHRPYACFNKAEVILRGRRLPLHLTLSCLRPVDGRHCGQCNKCAERRHAFLTAGVVDPTSYDGAEARPAPEK